MPFGASDTLSDADAYDVAAYMNSLDRLSMRPIQKTA